MMSDFARERAASAALSKFLDDAPEVARLFELANMEVPAPVARVLGMSTSSGQRGGDDHRISASAVNDRPDDWTPEWLWIDASQGSLNTLVLAILREAGKSLLPRQLIQKIATIQPETVAGSIYNVGPRLDRAGKIQRDNHGWQLDDSSDVAIPILQNGRLWGPKEAFEKYDIAAYRRQMIIDTLASEPDGLMTVQLTRKLAAADRCDTPINKDLVKVDLQVLYGKGLVRRGGGHAKKWRFVESQPDTK